MAKAKTRTVYRTRTKIKNRIVRVGGAVKRGGRKAGRGAKRVFMGSNKLDTFLADIGFGSTTAIVINEVKPVGLPKYVVPMVAGTARALTKSGNVKERAVHGAITAIDAYITDRLIKNQPIIPSLNLTSGSGGGIGSSGFTVVS